MERVFSHEDSVPFAPVTPSPAAQPVGPHARAAERAETPDLTRGARAPLILPGTGPGAAEPATPRRPGCSPAAQPKNNRQSPRGSSVTSPLARGHSLQPSVSLPGCAPLLGSCTGSHRAHGSLPRLRLPRCPGTESCTAVELSPSQGGFWSWLEGAVGSGALAIAGDDAATTG